MAKDIYEEAVIDAKRIRDEATKVVERQLLEQFKPKVTKYIEAALLEAGGDKKDDDSDEGDDDKDILLGVDFDSEDEEGVDKVDGRGDQARDVEQSMADEDPDEAALQLNTDGSVTLDLDKVVVPEDPAVQPVDDAKPDAGAAIAPTLAVASESLKTIHTLERLVEAVDDKPRAYRQLAEAFENAVDALVPSDLVEVNKSTIGELTSIAERVNEAYVGVNELNAKGTSSVLRQLESTYMRINNVLAEAVCARVAKKLSKLQSAVKNSRNLTESTKNARFASIYAETDAMCQVLEAIADRASASKIERLKGKIAKLMNEMKTSRSRKARLDEEEVVLSIELPDEDAKDRVVSALGGDAGEEGVDLDMGDDADENELDDLLGDEGDDEGDDVQEADVRAHLSALFEEDGDDLDLGMDDEGDEEEGDDMGLDLDLDDDEGGEDEGAGDEAATSLEKVADVLRDLDGDVEVEVVDDEAEDDAGDELDDLADEMVDVVADDDEEDEDMEEGDMYESDMEEGCDMYEVDLEEGNEDELDEMFEVDIQDLKKVVREMDTNYHKQDLDGPGDGVDDFGGASEKGEAFVDGDPELDEVDGAGTVKESRRRRLGRKNSNPTAREVSRLRRRVMENKRKERNSNLLSAKLLYCNKLLQRGDLSESQRSRVVDALDETRSLREAQLLYKRLSSALDKRSKKLTEGRRHRLTGSSSQPIASGSPRSGVLSEARRYEQGELDAHSQVLNESLDFDKWSRIAGLSD